MSSSFTLNEIRNNIPRHFKTLSRKTINLADPLVTSMQYTGLQDKNGTDIYEGDIVDIIMYGYPSFVKNTVRTVVVFEKGAFTCELPSLLCNSDNVIVLGNIYENPELI